MDAYAFDLQDGKVLKSKIYDRIGNSDQNNLQPFIATLQEFAVKSKFQEFYDQNKPFYNTLITSYRDSIGVPEMQKWLTTNFPSTRYDSFKIIFSPLVSGNQSASFFENNGFREAQAHVNFPFKSKNADNVSKQAAFVRQGNIVFTELNHSFIGPESQKSQYRDRIIKAFSKLDHWNDPAKPASNYSSPHASFDEYMNWALVNLRYVDFAPKAEQEKLIASIEDMMLNSRGFLKFPAFSQFLVKAYKSRKKGQNVADLYPQIVSWFENNA